MEELIKEFIEWMERGEGTKRTIIGQKSRALKLLAYCKEKGLSDAAKTGKKEVNEYVRYLTEDKGYSKETARSGRFIAVLLFSWLRDEKGMSILYHREREEEKKGLPDVPKSFIHSCLWIHCYAGRAPRSPDFPPRIAPQYFLAAAARPGRAARLGRKFGGQPYSLARRLLRSEGWKAGSDNGQRRPLASRKAPRDKNAPRRTVNSICRAGGESTCVRATKIGQ